MDLKDVRDALTDYAVQVRKQRLANPAVTEPGLAPAFQTLAEKLLSASPFAGLVVSPEFSKKGVGRPDIAIIATGQPPRAFVELKAPHKPTDPTRLKGHDKKQFERFAELGNWAFCNFHTFALYNRGDCVDDARIVPEKALRPETSDAAAANLIAKHDPTVFLDLFTRLCEGARHAPDMRDARALATTLAYSARLVRSIVADRLEEIGEGPDPLLDVRSEFQQRLFSHPQAGGYATRDFDILFSAAFAQTLAFGLLLVREATNAEVGKDAWEDMPEEHPLMRTTLRVLTEKEIVDQIGVGFDVIRDTINSFDLSILAVTGGRDPILYFYEDFLETFDPEARDRYGVYYTPVEVVRFMVGALDRSLRGMGHDGIGDDAVNILDPATGTGTFLLAVVDRLRANMDAAGHAPGNVALAMDGLTERMFGFELLVGPYAVAHYRLHHALHPPGSAGSTKPVRLGVYLADTLAEPGASAPAGKLGYVADPIADEMKEANRIKSEEPVLAIIGNPPYLRLPADKINELVGSWMLKLWDDLKAPVRDAGWGNQLNTFPDFYIAFWRWAIWKLFEADNAPRRGVIAFVTNRKFLTGKPYAGLRKMLRERFDRIEVFDLRGDHRAGGRAGVAGDGGVFNIQVGTAITLAIADGSRGGDPAKVHYYDLWGDGAVRREEKLRWLVDHSADGAVAGTTPLMRELLDDMRPRPFMDGQLLSIVECFAFTKSGAKSGNDPIFVAVTRERLQNQLEATAQVSKHNPLLFRQIVYRPFDRRWLYNDLKLLNRPGPDMQAAFGDSNFALYAMPSGTRTGPAVWCHALVPDYHAFRGSYGGYAFPLWDRRQAGDAPNLSIALIEGLEDAHGTAPEPQDVFDTILCLLSATSYTLRFAEDLEDVFPHVPWPATLPLFEEVAAHGARIRALETFAAKPSKRSPATFCALQDKPTGTLDARYVEADGGTLVLCGDGSGRMTGVDPRAWAFSVSGYPVLRRWLQGRKGLPADKALVDDIRDICGRILDLIDLFGQADHLLERTLDEALDRSTFG